MYLIMLDEKEKEAFLGIAYALTSADGSFSDEEKSMISAYCDEMAIRDVDSPIRSMDESVEIIRTSSSMQVKKIVIFEIVGLALVDGNYDESERELIVKIEKDFDISAGFSDDCEKLIREYLDLQSNIN